MLLFQAVATLAQHSKAKGKILKNPFEEHKRKVQFLDHGAKQSVPNNIEADSVVSSASPVASVCSSAILSLADNTPTKETPPAKEEKPIKMPSTRRVSSSSILRAAKKDPSSPNLDERLANLKLDKGGPATQLLALFHAHSSLDDGKRLIVAEDQHEDGS